MAHCQKIPGVGPKIEQLLTSVPSLGGIPASHFGYTLTRVKGKINLMHKLIMLDLVQWDDIDKSTVKLTEKAISTYLPSEKSN